MVIVQTNDSTFNGNSFYIIVNNLYNILENKINIYEDIGSNYLNFQKKI